jgi:hypothetical protein
MGPAQIKKSRIRVNAEWRLSNSMERFYHLVLLTGEPAPGSILELITTFATPAVYAEAELRHPQPQ